MNFDETPEGLRRLTLFLYMVVAPVFSVAFLVLARLPPTAPALCAVLVVMGLGALWLLIRPHPVLHDWFYPVSIAPIVACGIACSATREVGLIFLAIGCAPLVWSAILFPAPVSVLAWCVLMATGIVSASGRYGVGGGLMITVLLGVVGGLVAWAVARKSQMLRAATLRWAEHGARLESLLASMSEGMVVQDLSGVITECNPAAERILGLSKAEMVGRETIDPRWKTIRMDGTDLPGQELPAMECLRSGQPVHDVPIGIHLASGERSWIRISAEPVREPTTGAMIGAVTSFHDISTQIKFTEDLEEHARRANELAAQAEEANRAKSDFLATMSHEIRTPLNGVIGMVDLLLQTPLDPKQERYATVARSSGESLLFLINDILDFSKIEAGRLKLDVAEFDLWDLVQRSIDAMEPQAAAKGLHLRSEIAPDVPGIVRGDPARIRQILSNLIGNAVKFTQKGFVLVRCRSFDPEADSIGLRLEVADTGVGIAPDRQGGLFQRFSQADSGISRRFGGTGLGLAISKALADLMDGTLEVESEEGKGAMFRFEVRLEVPRKSPGCLQDDSSGDSNKSRSGGFLFTGARILLVEDNPVNREVALGMLGILGCRDVAVREEGRGALDALEAESFDLVLMDMQMPGMDGLEATRAIRDPATHVLDHRVPVVAMTANAFSEDRDRCIEAGMDDHLGKPITVETLGACLAKWLHRFQLERVDTTPVAAFPEPPGGRFTFDVLVQRLQGDREIAATVLRMFLTEAPGMVEEMVLDLDHGDSPQLAAKAHRLKGSSGNLGAEALSGKAAKLEDVALGRAEFDPAQLLVEIESEIHAIENEVRSDLEE